MKIRWRVIMVDSLEEVLVVMSPFAPGIGESIKSMDRLFLIEDVVHDFQPHLQTATVFVSLVQP